MAEIVTIAGSDLEQLLNSGKAAMLLITDGNDLRGDFLAAFRKAADQNSSVTFARINPHENPDVVERFTVGSKSVLIAWHAGRELVRRSRPWGTDVPLAVEMLQKAVKENPIIQTVETQEILKEEKTEENNIVDNKPVIVTDQTFQAEVIDYSAEMPVLVDFWAEWCGPCRMVAPILEKLAAEYAGKIRIAKVDVDANPGLAQYFRIMSIPTISLLKNRTMVFTQPGAFPEPAFRDLIEQVITLEVPDPETEPEQPSN